jgi:YHS domain-containing protein
MMFPNLPIKRCRLRSTHWARTAVFILLNASLPSLIQAENSATGKQAAQPVKTTNVGQRLFAEPIFANTNPYLFGSQSRLQFPVAASGYSVVALRDQQKWQAGELNHQVIYDGQLYWFATQREREIFAAAPGKYAPALGGDCVVSFVETAQRILGNPRYGVVHRGRIYFFASAEKRKQFQPNAERYAQADLGNGGNCIVSKIDQQKQIQGLPATIAVVGGLRYYFAGSHQRALFAAAPGRYGVKLSNLARPVNDVKSPNNDSSQPMPSSSQEAEPEINSEHKSEGQQIPANAKPLADQASPDITAAPPGTISDGKFAMEGYCPVSIREQGIWVRGNVSFSVEYAGKVFLMAGKSQQQKFQQTPRPYLPALDGKCLVTLSDTGQRIAGSVFYCVFIEDTKQIYLFAGSQQQRAFNANRIAYLEVAKAESTSVQYDGVAEATAKTGAVK